MNVLHVLEQLMLVFGIPFQSAFKHHCRQVYLLFM